MEQALEMVDVKVDIVPREATIQKMIQPGKSFIYNSLSSREYLQDLSDAITDAFGLPRREVGLKEDLSVDDTDWYILWYLEIHLLYKYYLYIFNKICQRGNLRMDLKALREDPMVIEWIA